MKKFLPFFIGGTFVLLAHGSFILVFFIMFCWKECSNWPLCCFPTFIFPYTACFTVIGSILGGMPVVFSNVPPFRKFDLNTQILWAAFSGWLIGSFSFMYFYIHIDFFYNIVTPPTLTSTPTPKPWWDPIKSTPKPRRNP